MINIIRDIAQKNRMIKNYLLRKNQEKENDSVKVSDAKENIPLDTNLPIL